jgi:endonuclease YncB( thermonuclease family)
VYAGVESFNERLVRDGMARAYMTDRGGPYAAGILAAEAEARKDRAGFWGTGFFK